MVLPLALDHHEGAHEDARAAHKLYGKVLGLAKEHDGEKNREHRGALVDGHDLVDVAHREGLEVADPARAGSEAGKRQKEQRVGCYLGNGGNGANHARREPRKHQDDDGANGRSNVRVGVSDTALGKN